MIVTFPRAGSAFLVNDNNRPKHHVELYLTNLPGSPSPINATRNVIFFISQEMADTMSVKRHWKLTQTCVMTSRSNQSGMEEKNHHDFISSVENTELHQSAEGRYFYFENVAGGGCSHLSFSLSVEIPNILGPVDIFVAEWRLGADHSGPSDYSFMRWKGAVVQFLVDELRSTAEYIRTKRLRESRHPYPRTRLTDAENIAKLPEIMMKCVGWGAANLETSMFCDTSRYALLVENNEDTDDVEEICGSSGPQSRVSSTIRRGGAQRR